MTKYNQIKRILRNEYDSDNIWGIPIIKKIDVPDFNLKFISFSNTKSNDHKNLDKTIHFFLDDWKFEKVFNYPEKYVDCLAQYKYVLTPDFSMYTDMPIAILIYNTFKNRYCGAYWQTFGIAVIPTISWSTEESFSFCFAGIQKGSPVAISTLGCQKVRTKFLEGFNKMMEIIEPSVVFCYGNPICGMEGNIVFGPNQNDPVFRFNLTHGYDPKVWLPAKILSISRWTINSKL